MKTHTGLAILIVVMLGAGSASQTQAAGQESAATAALANGTTLNAELSATLDSKKAKTGDTVTAHITEAVKEDDKTVIPKGAKLVGHVTQASARAKGDAESALAIQFDKAVLKNGQEIPLSVLLRAIAAEPRDVYQPGPEQSTMAGTPGAGQSPMGAGRSMGGPPSATASPIGGTGGGGPASDTDRTAGPGGGLNASGQLTPNSRGVFGLEGVQLATDGSNATKGSLLTSSGKTVHLNSGTRLLLVVLADVATAPNK